jgi:hypothetical protein
MIDKLYINISVGIGARIIGGGEIRIGGGGGWLGCSLGLLDHSNVNQTKAVWQK